MLQLGALSVPASASIDCCTLVMGGTGTGAAVRHGGGCRSVDLQARQGRVTVGAADVSALVPCRRVAADGDRGLVIIEALSTRWGMHDYQGGDRVWVQLRPHP